VLVAELRERHDLLIRDDAYARLSAASGNVRPVVM
jgi:hypothetical protein